jgi:hypothetical protein
MNAKGGDLMKPTNVWNRDARRGFRIAGALWLCGALVWAQTSAPPPVAQPGPQVQGAQILTAQQLDNLVAPIALYPDPLLGQVLAASTYPLELVEAQQWLQSNRNLGGTQLMGAARQQNWDPTVQALVAFPDVLAMLNRDIQWTTALGNAYLSQQNDVMAAIQSMRLRAEENGRLASTAQQTVTTQTQNGQSAIVIEPANPQVIYVPVYNPEYIWGPPLWGYYPPLWYPSIGFGFGFGSGIFLSTFYPGWGGWGWGGWPVGWGWGLGWFGGGLFVNNFFFNHYGFHGYYHGGFYRGGFPTGGREAWQHDPFHRAGVRYGNQAVAARYSNSRFAAGRLNNGMRNFGPGANPVRPYSGFGARGFGAGSAARGFAPSNQPGVGNVNRGFPGQRFNVPNSGRTFAGQSFGRGTAPQIQNRSFAGQANRFAGQANPSPGLGGMPRSFSAPRSFGGFGGASGGVSAPHSFGGFGGGGHMGGFGGGGHFGGGGGHMGGFGGGGHFGGGGGHFGGGGHGGRR